MDVSVLDTTIELDESVIADPPADVRSQVREYERGERRSFDLEVAFPAGTTGDVMAAMLEIPYGETRTYGELAAALETAPIAVGQACARNPVPLVVPCHRVVGSDGSLNGYSSGDGVPTKRRLLDLEAQVAGTEPVQTRLVDDR
ncbi:methylated-DNA--[protein]-cysteine S-methyltransferase [Natronosalvus vescus]|uniref:methylated-DNA--[protein]-cysteine S-methyltransferase n=1 Tax=Natronosalvus vescus TaxID=2953881 RepID=UPI0020907B3B|nr:methylated-DNA--[protein]-cysteine S-methyltransferase [Natronosalvus vescus]